MNFLIALLSHPFLLVVLATIIFLLSLVGSKKYPKTKFIGLFFLAFAIINVFSGSSLAHWMIYKNGVVGTAVILSQEITNNFYNEEPVIRYNVLLKKADESTLETYFESWDFNIYPAPKGGQYEYPEEGETFYAKYLPKNPNLFIIVNDNKGYSSQAAECRSLKTAMEEAERKSDFAPQDTAYQAEYEGAKGNYEERGCKEEIGGKEEGKEAV